MKLLLVYLAPFITSTGGAEKVCCDMANAMMYPFYIVMESPVLLFSLWTRRFSCVI